MEIKDIEYLVFCDAVKLDWQFAQLKNREGGFLKLHELLLPEKFKRKYDDGSVKQVYKSEEDLKNKAGTVMNLLEHVNDDRGSFLKDWEVIYGADNYKIAEDSIEGDKIYMKSLIEKIDKCLGKGGYILENIVNEYKLNISEIFKLSLNYEDIVFNSATVFDFHDLMKDENINEIIKESLIEIKTVVEKTNYTLESREKISSDHRWYNAINISLKPINFALASVSYSVFSSSKKLEFSAVAKDKKISKKIDFQNSSKASEKYKNSKITKLTKQLSGTKSESITEVFLSLVIQNVIGNVFNQALQDNKDILLSTAGSMFVSCFTRFSGFDTLNAGIQTLGNVFKENLSKSINKSVYGSGNILMGDTMPIYDSGFRMLVLKSKSKKEIVVVYKGDNDRGDDILPAGINRLKICSERIKEILKKESNYKLKIIGEKTGGELAILNNLLFPSSLNSTTKILINNKESFKNVKSILDFDLKYFKSVGYMESPLLYIGGTLRDTAGPLALGYVISLLKPTQVLANAMKLKNTNIVTNFWKGSGAAVPTLLKILGVGEGGAAVIIVGLELLIWVAVIAALVALLGAIINKILEDEHIKKMYEKLKKLGYVDTTKVKFGIQNYVNSNATKTRDFRLPNFSLEKNIPLDKKLGFYLLDEKKYSTERMIVMNQHGQEMKFKGGKILAYKDKLKKEIAETLKELPEILILKVNETITVTTRLTKTNEYQDTKTIISEYFKVKKKDKRYYA